jgi:arylsulfatase A-like enzyme
MTDSTGAGMPFLRSPFRTNSAAAQVLIALMAATLAAAPGCRGLDFAGSSAAKPKAVLLIVIDTLRGDRLGRSGYAEAVTPTLDSLATNGVFFSDAMTTAPVTLPAMSSLLTGRYPYHHSVRDNDRFVLPESETTLAERFRAAGWKTGAILASAVLAEDRGLDQGFDVYDDDFAPPYPVWDPTLRPIADHLATTQRRADRVTDRALQLAASFGANPWFLMVHYFDPHMHYDPPPRYREMHPLRPYDGEISFVDAEIGRLLAGLGRREEILVVVVSDHGESNDEHGEPQHGFLLYQSTLRIAALASGPGVPRGVVRSDLVSLIDVEPTLARMLDLPQADAPRRDGRALQWDRPADRVPDTYAEAFRPLVSYGWSELRALRRGEHKWIAGAGRGELYDVANDPGETADLGRRPPADDLAKSLARLAVDDDPEAVLRLAHGRPEPERTELLEGLGYIGGGAGPARLKARPHPLDALPRWLDTQRAKSLFKLAYLRIDSGRLEEGLSLLDRALDLDAGQPDIWYLRGYGRRLAGDLAGARDDFARCLALNPGHAAAFTDHADLESMATRRPSRRAPVRAPSPEAFTGIAVGAPATAAAESRTRGASGGGGTPVGAAAPGTDGRVADVDEVDRQ